MAAPRRRSANHGLVWVGIRDSLWFVPSLAVVAGSALAVAVTEIRAPSLESRLAQIWLFGGGAEGARGVLTAIAGSLITVTGTIFSVTIVALQLASSQFSPRILRTFVADRVNQVVLGVFIGTFTYTLLVLRTIHSASDGRRAFVPHVGVTVALVLLLVSVGALIAFINHAARSIQASVILHRMAEEGLARIAVLFPERVGRPAAHSDGWTPPDSAPGLIRADRSGYLQAIRDEPLWGLGDHHPSVAVRMELPIGAFAFQGKPIAAIWPAAMADEPLVRRAVCAAFVLGPERTPEQDVEYGVLALSDIAVRALSPGINDPTTAMHCIDRLAELLAALDARDVPERVRTDPHGRVRLITRPTTYARAMGLAFDPIRHYGAGNAMIAKRMLQALRDLAGVGSDEACAAIAAEVEAVLDGIRRTNRDPRDVEAVERLAVKVRAALEGAGGGTGGKAGGGTGDAPADASR